MRFYCILVLFIASLKAVVPASAGSPHEPGRPVNEHNTPVVKVGGVRQTITAVHPRPSPKQTEKSEAWWITFSGLMLLLLSAGAFFYPKAFMYGRRSWFWRDLLGEQTTAAMIRVISFILGIVGILFMLYGLG